MIRKFDSTGNQYYFKNSVSDARDLKNLAGLFDEDFKIKIDAFIDGRDFCDAVRRCLLNDLIAGAMDEDDDKKHY